MSCSAYGTYGVAVIDAHRPETLVVARHGSPVVLGIGEKEMFVASDVAALIGHTRQVVYLDDGELATVTATEVHGVPVLKIDVPKWPPR